MLIHIAGRTYNADDALRRPKLNDLYELKVKSRSEEYPLGVSIERLKEYMVKLGKVKTVGDLVDDAETMLGLKALLFLVRRHDGDKVTFEEAGDVTLDQIVFEREESDAAVIEEARAKRVGFRKRRTGSVPAGA